MRSALLLVLLLLKAGPASQADKRSFEESFALVKKGAQGWSKESFLLKVFYKSAFLLDVNPHADRFSEIEFTYGTKEGSPPGEMKTRVWTLAPDDRAPRDAEPKVARSGSAPLPEKFALAKTAALILKQRGMKFDPILELAAVHGRPIWYTRNGGQDVWIADGVSGEFLYFANAEVGNYMRDQTTQITPWKQAVDAIEKDLRGWKAGGTQASTVRASSVPRKFLDKELGLSLWEFSIYVDKPSPAMFLYRIANGDVAYWALDNVPADRTHFTALSAWNLAAAGGKISEHLGVKTFLATLPRIQPELLIDVPRMKAGEALFRIKSLEASETIEVTLDKKGTVKSAAKK